MKFKPTYQFIMACSPPPVIDPKAEEKSRAFFESLRARGFSRVFYLCFSDQKNKSL